MLDEQVSVYWLEVNARRIELKRMKAGAHLAFRHDENTRDVYGLLHNETGGLMDNIGDIRLLADASQFKLRHCNSFCHFLDDLLLDIIVKQASRIGQNFVLLDNLVCRLG